MVLPEIYSQVYRKFIIAAIALAVVLVTGTAGYYVVGGQRYSLLDCLYMTVITISTIGFGEIIDLSASPAGRVFTIFIALSGVGVLFYIITNFTAFVVEGELKESFRRRKMEKLAQHYKDHFIVCGIGSVGLNIVHELNATHRPFIIVDINKENIDRYLEMNQGQVYIDRDATDNNSLLLAGIDRARGVFAVTGDDNQNLVISLTARQLNPRIRVIARCNEIRNSDKMKKAGADSVVSPNFIGGLRMASEMIRPSVVTFLDTMLRDKDINLRIEEVSVEPASAGKPLSALNLKKYPGVLLLAVKAKGGWIYNPADNYVVGSDDVLVFMTTPGERGELEKLLQ